MNFSSNAHTFLFSELSLKEHLLSKDTNYTITFSMSAVRHCAEAMFLKLFANAACIFLLPFFVCQQITECAAVKFEPEKKELLSISWVGLFFRIHSQALPSITLVLKVHE